MNQVDVVIIGAGAAGMMCAIEAGKRGRSVLLIDHARKAGKKILISGGGRCNFTNYFAEPSAYLSGNPHFCISALRRYTQYDFIALMDRHGIAHHEKKSGQLFCNESAKDVVAMLLSECRAAGVELQVECELFDVQALEPGFVLNTNRGAVQCQSLVMASGGLSIPKMGATGIAFRIARQFGISVTDTRPALVPFTFGDTFKQAFEDLPGISLEASVRCRGGEFREHLLFTHRGLSGPAILQISSYWREGDAVLIDLLPGINGMEWLKASRQSHPNSELKTTLAEHFPKRFAQRWCELHGWSGAIGQYSDERLQEVVRSLQHWSVVPGGTEGYRTAEVTLGGVDTAELSSKTMAANRVAGLYFVGECVDVTGWLGGYNFQWAWSSGWCAGQYA